MDVTTNTAKATSNFLASAKTAMINEGPADYAIVTSYSEAWKPLARITDQLKWEYAKMHGYHFFADCSTSFGAAGTRQSRYPAGDQVSTEGFIKLDLLLHFLPRYKGVVWMDADLVLTNRDITLESFFDRFPDKGVMVEEDHNGFHSTVIFARNQPLVLDYFHAANTVGRSFYLGDAWHEMQALRNFWLDNRYHDLVGFMRVKDACPIYRPEYVQFGLPMDIDPENNWAPGDFALHLGALNLGRRMRLAEHFADHARHHLPPPPGPDAEHP